MLSEGNVHTVTAFYSGLILAIHKYPMVKAYLFLKGPVKLIKRVKIAHSFLQCTKSVPRYHFKLAYVILQMAVEEFFKTHF